MRRTPPAAGQNESVRRKLPKMKTLLALSLLSLMAATSALAAKLNDVSILDELSNSDGLELKLHTASGPKDSYFFVTIEKQGQNSFDQLALVIRKLQLGDRFKLSLVIPSFSMTPSGSSYRNGDIQFSGTPRP